MTFHDWAGVYAFGVAIVTLLAILGIMYKNRLR
jgi:hypothetical protein